MSGAYAHIAAVHHLLSGNILGNIDIPTSSKRALSSNPAFAFLGSVSPDYPYLDILSGDSCAWADAIHHSGTDDFIRHGIELLQEMKESANRDKCLAWFLGFTAHIILDMTMHPIVEKIAGPYSASSENQKKHRICEMHQDAYIWQSLDIGPVGSTEEIDNFKLCEDNGHICEPLRLFWDSILKHAYPNIYEHNEPNISKWHSSFKLTVDAVEESHSWPRIARHVASNCGLAYPTFYEIDEIYIESLTTPLDTKMHYDDVFKKALQHISNYWSLIANHIDNNANDNLDFLGDWNLDTGLDSTGEYLLWNREEKTSLSERS